MIKFVTPKPFFYEGDERAVLLLHSFTSTTSGMKRLANYLNSRGILAMYHYIAVMVRHPTSF